MKRKNGHTTRLPGRPLARPGDPYVTIWGEQVKPDSFLPNASTASKAISPEEFRSSKRRSAKELPAPPKVLNAVACVFLYTVLGLGDREIAEAIKSTPENVTKLRSQVAYKDCFEAVASEFINANSELITARLAAYSHGALSQIADISFNGKEERNRLRASGDLLDRAGFAPRENVNRGMSMNSDQLRIVVLKADKDLDVSINGEEV